jgi:hypothetical protein
MQTTRRQRLHVAASSVVMYVSSLVPLILLVAVWATHAAAFDIPEHNEPGTPSLPISVAPGELVLAVVIVRHGDRSPQRHAPSFAAGDRRSLVGSRFPIDYSNWSVDTGQLTALGMQQMREFGMHLRQRYITSVKGNTGGFLSDEYKHAETHVRAADVDRTLVSAMNAMQGLYQDPNADERAQIVVPVHTVEFKRDSLMDGSSKEHCPRWFNAGKAMLQTGLCRGAVMRNTALLNALPTLTGRDTSDLSFEQLVDLIAAVQDVRVCQRAHGITQPNNVTRFDSDLNDIVARVSIAKWDVTGLGVLVGGRLLRAVAARMVAMRGLLNGDARVQEKSRDECNVVGRDSDADGTCPRKLVVYCGHDTTVMDIRSALGLNAIFGGADDEGVAPYASHLMFELRRRKAGKRARKDVGIRRKGIEDSDIQTEYTVTVLQGSHQNETTVAPGPFCGGKASCGLEKFLKFVHARVPENVDESCGLPMTKDEAIAEAKSIADKSAAHARGMFIFALFLATAVGILLGYVSGSAVSQRVEYTAIPNTAAVAGAGPSRM